jgi:nanoRNase/pAp phosphatase (c-di-AMP/oligoRNAs hydrolase)/CBS domain-containing protein
MERALPTPAFASASACARRDGFVGRRRSTGPTRRGANAEPATNDGPVQGVGRAWRESRAARTLCRATPKLGLGGSWDANDGEDDEDFHDPPTPNDWHVPGSPAATASDMPPLGVVLTHVSADFDTLSSAVGLAKLRNHRLGANCTFVVLPRGASPGVAHYVQLHKNKFPIREKRAFPSDALRWVGVVDAQRRDRLADCASWLDVAEEVVVLDHHVLATSDIDATELIVEQVGATATVVAEMLDKENVPITEEDATLLGLGIHADTGSLTFEATTPRDAKALAYCLEKGASQKVLAEYCNPSLTAEQRDVIARGMRDAVSVVSEGLTVSRVHVECAEYTPGMATCAKDVLDLTDSDVLLMAVSYVHGKKNPYRHVSVIGRAKPVKGVDLSSVLRRTLGGGGHPKAASAAFRMDQEVRGGDDAMRDTDKDATSESADEDDEDQDACVAAREDIEACRLAGDVEGILDALVRAIVQTQIPPQKTARDVMRRANRVVSAPPDMTMGELGDLLERNDHRSCPVISRRGGRDGTDASDAGGTLLGVVSITEVDVAAIKGQLDRPVSGYMKLRVAVAPDTPVSECERILVEQGEGCIPVVENFDAPRREWRMAGLVTRATILKTHEYYRSRRLSAEPRVGVEKKEGDAASSSGGGENARDLETASIDATKFPPGLVPGEVPRAPRVTFDEHLFFSQDELDKVRVPTKGAFDSLKDLAENAPRAGPKTSGTETDASSS